MKLLILVWSRLKQYIQANYLAFAFFMSGSIVCSLILIYVYGNTVSAFNIISGNDYLYRSYTINLSAEEPFSQEKLAEMQNNWPFMGVWQEPMIIMQKKADQDDFPDINFIASQYGTPLIEAGFNEHTDLSPVQGDISFSGFDFETQDPPVILPSEIPLRNYDNETFRIKAREYKIIGRYAGFSSVIIPKQVFFANDFQPDFIIIRFAQIDNNLQIQNEVNQYLAHYFPGCFIQPPFYIGLDPTETNVVSALLVILYGLALSSISFISDYLFEQNRSVDVIYRRSGCSKKKLIKISLLQNTVLSTVILLVSLGIHKLLYKSIFIHLNLSPEITYSTTDYLRISVIILIATWLLYLIRQHKATARKAVLG